MKVEGPSMAQVEAGAKRMYEMMNQLDPDSETVTESMGVYS